MAKTKSRIEVDPELCKGCGVCVEMCPTQVLILASRRTRRGFHPPEQAAGKECRGCKLCEMTCPDLAIWTVADDGK